MQTRNEIKVFFADQKQVTVFEASNILDTLNKEEIAYLSWPSYPYKPSVSFAIAYAKDSLLLKYYVEEKSVRASASHINGEVYKDSCVEVFLSFDKEHYYNLEFNCLGVALVAYGKSRAGREFLSKEVIKNIQYQTSSYNKEHSIAWELTLVVPFAVFVHDDITSLKDKTISGNFYKCGDELPEPHFLSWSPIQAAEPDFHLPQFFGHISFG